jgi:hypothetical protein
MTPQQKRDLDRCSALLGRIRRSSVHLAGARAALTSARKRQALADLADLADNLDAAEAQAAAWLETIAAEITDPTPTPRSDDERTP